MVACAIPGVLFLKKKIRTLQSWSHFLGFSLYGVWFCLAFKWIEDFPLRKSVFFLFINRNFKGAWRLTLIFSETFWT